MDKGKYYCGHCNTSYKNLSSLKRHEQSKHLHRTYLCRKYNRFYIHRCDFKTHCIKIHQKLILDPSEDYVIYDKPSATDKPSANTTHTSSTNQQHSKENTTNMLLGQNQPGTSTAQWDTLRQDLMISDSESDSPNFTSISTNTIVHVNPSDSKEVNTSPILIRDLMGQKNPLYNSLLRHRRYRNLYYP